VTTVPVPSAETDRRRQGTYAGAVSRLVASRPTSCLVGRLHARGVARERRSQAVTGHSYSFGQDKLLSFVTLEIWSSCTLRTSGRSAARHVVWILGLQVVTRQARHRGRQPSPDTRTRVHPLLQARIGFLALSNGSVALSRLHRVRRVVYDWGRPGRSVALVARKEGHCARGRPRDAGGIDHTPTEGPPRIYDARHVSPKSADHIPGRRRHAQPAGGMNAMAFEVMIPFRDALREIGSDNGVRVVVNHRRGTRLLLRSGPREPRDDAEHGGPHPSDDRAALPWSCWTTSSRRSGDSSTRDRSRQRWPPSGADSASRWLQTSGSRPTTLLPGAGINNGLTAAELG